MSVHFPSNERLYPSPSSMEPGHAAMLRESQVTSLLGCGLTTTEITRLALRVLGVSATGAGMGAVYLACIGLIAWPLGLLSIPFGLISAGAFWYSNQLNDYDNPEELVRFRNQATGMNLRSIIQTFGWNDLLQYGILTPEDFSHKYSRELEGKSLVEIIEHYEKTVRHVSECPSPKFNYEIPSPHQFSRLWRMETASKTFEEILNTYPLEKLERYNIVEAGELHCLKALKLEFHAFQIEREQKAAAVEQEFASNTQAYKRVLDEECARADRMYNDHFAVRELQGFELQYARQRQRVQDEQAMDKANARARFDLAIASFTQAGQIPYHKLPPQDKVRYDQLRAVLQTEESQADQTACRKIDQINFERQQRLCHLSAEKERVGQDRARVLEAARSTYNTAVASHQQRKEDKLREIDQSLRARANDFNGRYRAYLRTIGARV